MGYLYNKFQEAQKTRFERDTINKVVRVLAKSMEMWVSLYRDFGAPPSAEECAALEDVRIRELLAEYRPKVAKGLGREILTPDELVDNREAELEIELMGKRGLLFQKYSGAIKKLEEQAAEHLGKAISGLAAKVDEVRGTMPTKLAAIEEEFQELMDELTQDIEARYPEGVSGLDKFDDTLPAGIPSWEMFLVQVEEKKTELAAENTVAVAKQIDTMKESAEAIIKEKINAAIRATIDEIKLDLSDDPITFLDEADSEKLRRELMDSTEAYGASHLA
jgi:hypothetical protein